jgi:GT2 family glycosyltransferase
MTGIAFVVPTVGRPSLRALLERLPAQAGEVIVVDDRPAKRPPLWTPSSAKVIPGPGRGPAAARNAGWRASDAGWIVFLDDDVIPGPGWWGDLQADLAQPETVDGVQGRILVPQGHPNELSDWAASTARLSDAAWITADMAYRREALEEVGGFDERFPRAYREDTDLAYRIRQSGRELVLGRRRTLHPVRTEGRWISLRMQRGNADDALLRRTYGPGWHRLLGVPHGRRRIHALTTTSALVTAAWTISALTRGGARFKTAGLLAGATWALATTEFVLSRRRHAPAEPLAALIATSVAIPPVAIAHWLRGWWQHRGTPALRTPFTSTDRGYA